MSRPYYITEYERLEASWARFVWWVKAIGLAVGIVVLGGFWAWMIR